MQTKTKTEQTKHEEICLREENLKCIKLVIGSEAKVNPNLTKFEISDKFRPKQNKQRKYKKDHEKLTQKMHHKNNVQKENKIHDQQQQQTKINWLSARIIMSGIGI
jgi:hypothetical protein